MFRILNMPEPKKSEGLYAAVTKGAQFCVFKPENVIFMKKLTEVLIGKMFKTFYQRKNNYILWQLGNKTTKRYTMLELRGTKNFQVL